MVSESKESCENGNNYSWIFEQIKNLGCNGCYDTVKVHVRTIKAGKRRQAFTRFETIPGLQGQVDWADFKISIDGAADITVYLFVLVLGFSRAMYAELVSKCSLQAFLDAHLHAFKYLGGGPAELLYDNIRHVFMGASKRAQDYQCRADAFCQPLHVQADLVSAVQPLDQGQGGTRPIDYIRERFWRGYVFKDIGCANQDLLHWLSHTANRRVHGTHHQPVDVRWQQEVKRLNPIPADYDTAIKVYRTVYKDCMISYNTNRYHVPPEAIGKKVLLKIKDGTIHIFDDERLLITHVESSDRHRWITDPAIIHLSLNKKEVMALFDMDFVAKQENVIFLGPPGVGKTHLAISLATKACHHGFKVYFTTMDTLMRKLKEPQSRHKAYLTSTLVVVDEVGYLPIDSKEAYLFFQFVSYRYERSSTIITSNKSFGDWQELFGDPVIATAIWQTAA